MLEFMHKKSEFTTNRRASLTLIQKNEKVIMSLIFLAPESSCMLIGNKMDLPPKFRAVTTEEALEFAREYGCNFMETSAKDNTNCTRAFMEFMQCVLLSSLLMMMMLLLLMLMLSVLFIFSDT
jgi:hypothetical protein